MACSKSFTENETEEKYCGKSRRLPAWLAESSSVNDRSDVSLDPHVSLVNQQQERFPILKFHGNVCYYNTIPEASLACEIIRNQCLSSKNQSVIGFDMEWTPTFQRGREACTAVIQICADHFNVHVIHLAAMTGLPPALRLLIENPGIIKTGVGIKNDIRKLGRDFLLPAAEIIEQSVVELATLGNAVLQSSQNWSLDRLVEHVLKMKLPKPPGIRCGNWNRYPLSEKQLEYAALDAYASFILYEDLKSLEVETNS